MALGWALKEMSDSQFLQMCDRMNDRAKQNLPILNTIRRELAGDEDFLTFVAGQEGGSGRNCLLGLSDRSLYVGFKVSRGGNKLESLSFSEIIFGGFRRTRMFGRLDVWQSGVERHFNSSNKDMMQAFSFAFFERHDAWHEQHPRIDASASANAPSDARDSRDIPPEHPVELLSSNTVRKLKGDSAPNAESLGSELQLIVELWRDGILDDREFQLAKRKLLG